MAVTNSPFTTITLGFILTLILTWIPRGTAASLNCPPAEKIKPCYCKTTDKVTLGCHEFSQDQLTNFMTAVRKVNSGNILDVHIFDIRFGSPETTTLTSLDLTPLSPLNIDILLIQPSSYAPKIGKRSTWILNDRQMTVKAVNVLGSPLKAQDLTNLFSYINPETGPVSLTVAGCPNITTGGQGSTTLIPGLTFFKKLSILTLLGNQISNIPEGAFKGLSSLFYVYLKGNTIRTVEKGAFDLGVNIYRAEGDNYFIIDLSDNNLIIDRSTNSFAQGFIPQTGNGNLKYSLSIENNSLEFLPEEFFKPLLYPAGPVHVLSVKDNRFICDDRMKWIRSKRITAKVDGVDCTNDRGHTIFTTKLVTDADDTDTDENKSGGTNPTISVLYGILGLSLLGLSLYILTVAFKKCKDSNPYSRLENTDSGPSRPNNAQTFPTAPPPPYSYQSSTPN